MPDGKARFPFLEIEFKSQATGGTHFVATNQAANAGAIAMEGTLQLTRKISAEGNLDFDEPQFFSLSNGICECPLAKSKRQNRVFSIYMERLQTYELDADGLIAVNHVLALRPHLPHLYTIIAR